MVECVDIRIMVLYTRERKNEIIKKMVLAEHNLDQIFKQAFHL